MKTIMPKKLFERIRQPGLINIKKKIVHKKHKKIFYYRQKLF